METQTWLSRHYKFISAENITLLSVTINSVVDITGAGNLKIDDDPIKVGY